MATIAVLAGVAVACTGGSTPAPSPSQSIRGSSPPSTQQSPRGGEITIGVEQWSECLNPILSCAQPPTYRTVLYHVLPRAVQFAPDGSLVPSPLLTQAPTLENGGLTQAPFTVRFVINDAAVWDDGSPITSEDFAFTWRAIVHTPGAVELDDYRRILALDTSDPKVAVLNLGQPWAGWTELFGGSKGFVLDASAFPAADPDAPSLQREMQEDIQFSGGPFRLVKWDSHRAELVRNERYLGPRAYLDRVTFVLRFDGATQLEALENGDVDAIAPSVVAFTPPPFNILDDPPISWSRGDGNVFEALWFDAHEQPLNDPLVREALMYAIDRQGVIDRQMKLYDLNAEVLNCGFLALPKIGPSCRTRPFERFTYDPARSLQLLDKAGYDCSAHPCTKDGRPLRVRYITNSVSVMRTTTQELLIDPALAAGFDLKMTSFYGGILFTSQCPLGRVAVSACGMTVPPDASVTNLLSCDAITGGLNRIGWCNAEADQLMHESDRELDPNRRADLLDRLYEMEAEDMIGLPLYAVPAIVGWWNTRLEGPIDAYLSTPYGPLFNISEWLRVDQ